MSPLRVLAAIVLAWLAAVLLWVAAMTLFAPPAHAQSWPDRERIAAAADSAGVDVSAALAIAWEETASNVDPSVRGHHCWYTIDARTDTLWTKTWPHILEPSRPIVDTVIVIPRRPHHEKDCEVGRFQIKPSTARARCPGLNVFRYDGNLACFVAMFKADADARGNLYAIAHHNGAGPRARDYLARVLKTVGWLAETT